MAIIRTPKTGDRPYFSLARAAAQDERLSFEARGVLAYLLSKPDGWQVQPEDLRVASGVKEILADGTPVYRWGMDKTYAVLIELKTHGYLTRTRVRTAAGTFEWEPYQLYELPQAPVDAPTDASTDAPTPILAKCEDGQQSFLADPAPARRRGRPEALSTRIMRAVEGAITSRGVILNRGGREKIKGALAALAARFADPTDEAAVAEGLALLERALGWHLDGMERRPAAIWMDAVPGIVAAASVHLTAAAPLREQAAATSGGGDTDDGWL